MTGPRSSIEPDRQYVSGLLDQLDAMVICLSDLETDGRSMDHEAYIAYRTSDPLRARREARKLDQATTEARAAVAAAKRAVGNLRDRYTHILRITE
jgi:hypothetical protein